MFGLGGSDYNVDFCRAAKDINGARRLHTPCVCVCVCVCVHHLILVFRVLFLFLFFVFVFVFFYLGVLQVQDGCVLCH